MKVLIKAGAEVDIPTRAEMAADMQSVFLEQAGIEQARERERLRGKKDMRRSTLVTTPAQTRVTTLDDITPQAGYKWVVRLLGVYLASAGTGTAFITSDSATTLGALTQARPVAALTTSAQYQVATLPQGACVLDAGEGLYLNFTQNILGYMIAGWEAIAEKIGELA